MLRANEVREFRVRFFPGGSLLIESEARLVFECRLSILAQIESPMLQQAVGAVVLAEMARTL